MQQTPRGYKPSSPAERDPLPKTPRPPTRCLQGRPLTGRGAAVPDLLYHRRDGAEGTNRRGGGDTEERARERCPAAPRTRRSCQGPSFPFPRPSGSFPRAHRSWSQTNPPTTGKVTPGTRNAGKAKRDPGDVNPMPDASRNPARGRLAVANSHWGEPPNPISWQGGLRAAVPTSFRSKSCSTCLEARAGRARRLGGFPCPGRQPACHADTEPPPDSFLSLNVP